MYSESAFLFPCSITAGPDQSNGLYTRTYFKTFEEWRKLKIANDVKEGVLIPRAAVAETVRKLGAKFGELLTAKLEQEYPATVAGLDVPSARIYGKKLNDQIRAEVRTWAEDWGGR